MTNSNVYGVTIAEHVVMVTLMLLRRMPEYERDRPQPTAGPTSCRCVPSGTTTFTILGTGDIGVNAAERLRGMGAARIVGLSRSGRPRPGL